jgi:hydrogenase large subunit
VQEFVTHSWYNYPDNDKGLHPWDGITEPNYELGAKTKGTRTNIEEVDESAKYSWVKSPRWRGHAMEVGPLARYILGYAHALKGNPHCQRVKEQLEGSLRAVNHDLPKALGLAETNLSAKQLCQARSAAPCPRPGSRVLRRNDGRRLERADDQHPQRRPRHANVEKWDPSTWPAEAKGSASLPRRAARWALDPDQGRQDRELPVRRAQHLERQPA